MSLPIAIAVIVLADLALIGLLTFVVTRAKLLTAHVSTATAAIESPPVAATPPRLPAAARRARARAPRPEPEQELVRPPTPDRVLSGP